MTISTAVDTEVEDMDHPKLSWMEKLDAGLCRVSDCPPVLQARLMPPTIKKSDELVMDLGMPDRQPTIYAIGEEIGSALPDAPFDTPLPIDGDHMVYQGLLLHIENPVGSTRSGVTAAGKAWSVCMKHHYGEIVGTRGDDNDPVDVFVGCNPDAPMAYVLHQRLDPTMSYDEDKVMLGFDCCDDALAAYVSNYDSPVLEPGITEIPVSELRERFAAGELEMGPIVKSFDLMKGRKALPIGWISFRADGHYRKKGPDEWVRVSVNSVKWAADSSRTVSDLAPGDVVEVGGRDGLYMLDPAAGKQKGKTSIAVVSLASGEKEKVRASTIVAMKPAAATAPVAAKKVMPPPKADKPGPTFDEALAARAARVPPPAEGTGEVEPGEKAKRAGVVKGSDAKPGTIRYKLENGEYMLQQVKDRRGVRARWAMHVPDADMVALVTEFTPLMHSVSRKIAKKRPFVPVLKHGQPTPEYEEILSGAKLGMLMALRNYDGSRPWFNWAEGYMKAYAAQGKAGATGSSVPWTEKDKRLVHTFIAAEYLAKAAADRKGVEVTDKSIAERWYIRKNQVFTGHSESMGTYMGPTGGISQGSENVPMEDWKVKTPTGEDRGKSYPGKINLIKKMRSLMAGDRVSSIVDENQIGDGAIYPPEMPAGLVEHVKGELESAVEQLGEPYRTVIRMLSGLSDDTPGDTGGEASTKEQIATAIGIGAGQSPITMRRKLRESGLMEQSLAMLQQIATARGYTAAKYIDHIFPKTTIEDKIGRDDKLHSTWGPSHNELLERFGDEKGIRIYQAAIRHGESVDVGLALDRRKAGILSKPEEHELHRKHAEWELEDRRTNYQRYRAHPIPPEAVGTSGPQEGRIETSLTDDHIRAMLRSHQLKRME